MKKLEYFPLSHPQKRIWLIEKVNPSQPMHNIGGVVRIAGNVDFPSLEYSINEFIKNNSGIRHRFTETNNDVKQYICEYRWLNIALYEFNNEEELQAWIREEAKTPFNLYEEDLYRFIFFKLTDSGESGYLVKVHHIISDGWSINILASEVFNVYKEVIKGGAVPVSNKETYTYFLNREANYLSSKRFFKNKEYWMKKFTPVPFSTEKTVLECSVGERKSFKISSHVTRRIKRFTSEHDVSIYSFFVALYYMYLYKVTNHKDLTIGMPVLNRAGKKEKNIFGMFTSTMPFRYILNGEMTAADVVKGINNELTNCYFHQKYPYNLLVQDLELKKKDFGDLFSACINYYNTNLPTELDGAKVSNEEFYNGTQIYDLQVIIREWSEHEFNLDFDYKTHKFEDTQIEMIFECMMFLIEQMLDGGEDQKLDDIQLLSKRMKSQLIEQYNDTQVEYPKQKTIQELFKDQVERTPNKIAISLGGSALSYRNLDKKSNQIANYLVRKGVTTNTVVGVAMTHSFETIIGILGILKAGGVYLPIDPQYPLDRINYMMKDANMSILLSNIRLEYSEITDQVEIIDLRSSAIYENTPVAFDKNVRYSDLAYIIYTSGSTGKPKGAMITQQGLVNYITWAQKEYIGAGEEEVFPLYSSLAFDLTVTSIFTPLISGSQIVIYPQDKNEYVLYKIIKEQKATIIKLTPSHLSILLDADLDMTAIRKIIVGGDSFPVKLANRLQEKTKGKTIIYNEYGPTETVVGCMIHQFNTVQDDRLTVPIGKPIQNVQIYLLDSKHSPVPVGEAGEIFIAGAGVAKGYLNNPELTSERFINNPFSSEGLMYRTGDLGKFIEVDKMEYIRRVDDQIKVRGFRIELAEIERSIERYPGIKEAVVVKKQYVNGSEYLCAYYTGDAKIDSKEIMNLLRDFLPDYMVPSYFIQLEELPLTINAKIDRSALPEPEFDKSSISNANKTEELLSVVSDVLNTPDVDIQDNFYYLGGDSIKAIQLVSRLNEKGFTIKTKDILANPVMADMILYLELNHNGSNNINQPCEGTLKGLPAADWFFSQDFYNKNHYTQSLLLKLSDDVDSELLIKALQYVVQRHDSFCLNFSNKDHCLYFNESHRNKQIKVKRHDLSGHSRVKQLKEIERTGEQLKASININSDFLLKASFFEMGTNGRRLLITSHHLAIDGVSWRILLEELNQTYSQLEEKKNNLYLPSLNKSIKDWAAVLQDLSKKISSEEKQYWNKVIQKSRTQSFSDYEPGQDQLKECESLKENLTEEETSQLLTNANKTYRTKADELMITALAMVLSKYYKSNEVTIELEGHGRENISEEIDVSNVIGWFTSLYPITLNIKGEVLSSNIKNVKEQMRNVPNKGLHYGVLRYITQEFIHEQPRLIRFNYLGDFNSSFSNNLFQLAEENSGRDISEMNELDSLIEINSYIVDNKLMVSFTYGRKTFKSATVIQLVKDYMEKLRELIKHCCLSDQTEFTPSDFDTVDLSSEELEEIFD